MSTVTGQAWAGARNTAAARSGKKTVMKLTTRGKAVFTGLGAAVLMLVAMGAWNGVAAQSAPTTQQVTSYVVRPGDTLWSYASSITEPGEDVRETVADLMELNNMDSSSVAVGERLVVPVR